MGEIICQTPNPASDVHTSRPEHTYHNIALRTCRVLLSAKQSVTQESSSKKKVLPSLNACCWLIEIAQAGKLLFIYRPRRHNRQVALILVRETGFNLRARFTFAKQLGLVTNVKGCTYLRREGEVYEEIVKDQKYFRCLCFRIIIPQIDNILPFDRR